MRLHTLVIAVAVIANSRGDWLHTKRTGKPINACYVGNCNCGLSVNPTLLIEDVVSVANSDSHVRWDIECLAEQGFLRIKTCGVTDLAIAIETPSPNAGMEISYGGSSYVLSDRISRGWRVKRQSDGEFFRMTLSQVKEAVRTTHPVQYSPMVEQSALALF